MDTEFFLHGYAMSLEDQMMRVLETLRELIFIGIAMPDNMVSLLTGANRCLPDV